MEQNCPYQDIGGDDLGGKSHHIFGWHNGTLVAYARILESDDELQPIVIDQVVVSEALCGERIGQQLMSKALESRTRRWPEKLVYLGAQMHLQNFCGQFGFVPVTDIYEEDGIPHVGMIHEVIQA